MTKPPIPEATATPDEESGIPSHSRPSPSPGRPPAPSSRAAAASSPAPSPPTPKEMTNGKRQGLHVWVRTSARDPTLLLVRVLPDGHPAPPGAYEAYLQAVEDGANLLAPKH